MTSYYLAHGSPFRHEVRKWELSFEKRTGINLVNPFFDLGEEKVMVEHRARPTMKTANLIVNTDIRAVVGADGIIVLLEKEYPYIGSVWEMAVAYNEHLPIYVVAPKRCSHPFLMSFGAWRFESRRGLEWFLVKKK